MSRSRELISYALWAVGSALFVLASYRSGDWISFAASVMYLIGSVTFLLSITRP